MNAFDEPGPSAPAETGLSLTFDVSSLYTLRAAVAAHASQLGLTEPRLARLLVVATELATNAIRHGDGSGSLRLWREDGTIRCEVSDNGPGIGEPHLTGTHPAPLNDSGRGLYLIRQFADDVTIVNRPQGVTVTVTFTV